MQDISQPFDFEFERITLRLHEQKIGPYGFVQFIYKINFSLACQEWAMFFCLAHGCCVLPEEKVAKAENIVKGKMRFLLTFL